MADASDPIEVHVARFLGASSLDDFLREDFNRFQQEMSSLRSSIEALRLSTDQAAKAQRDLSGFYTGTARSENASLAPNAPVDPQTGRPLQPGTGFLFGQQPTPSGQRSDTASDPTGNPDPPAPRSFLRALSSGVSAGYQNKSLGAAADTFFSYRPIPTSSGPSSGASIGRPGGPWENFLPGSPDEPLEMPRIGEFTAQNLLEYLGSAARNRADTRYLAGDRGLVTNSLGRGARALYGMADFAPKMAMFHQFAASYGYDLRSHTRTGTGGLEGLGEQYGISGSGSDIEIPGTHIGFRVPFLNSAGWRGIKSEASKWWQSFSPGINKEQLNFMEQQQLARGWQSYGPMHEGMKDLIKWNKGIGTNEGVWDLADKATRYGTTSMNDFVKTMKMIPDAAHAAHVSMDQIVTDANAIGELNQSQGGTHAMGQQVAIAMAALTGMDPGALSQAFTNPYVQSYAFLHTGLPFWMQGLQTPGQRTENLVASVNQMYGRLGNIKGPSTRKVGDSYINVDPRDAKIATLKMFFPELSPEQLKAMTNDKNAARIETGATLDEQLQDWAGDVHRAKARGDATRLGILLDKRDRHGDQVISWGHMAKALHSARGADGKPLLTPADVKAIQDAGKAGHWERVKEEGHVTGARGAGPGHVNLIRTPDHFVRKWVGQTQGDAAEARLNKFREVMAHKSEQAMQGPKITIELGKAASKVMHLESNMKKGNAAQIPLNQYYGGNNLAPPMPTLTPYSSGSTGP